MACRRTFVHLEGKRVGSFDDMRKRVGIDDVYPNRRDAGMSGPHCKSRSDANPDQSNDIFLGLIIRYNVLILVDLASSSEDYLDVRTCEEGLGGEIAELLDG